MVDFRYHLVTIIAIFLALALGIVVGTTQLNGQVLDDLNGRISGLANDKRALEKTVQQERQIRESDDALLSAEANTIVAGRLTGERVVVISSPNAPGDLREELIPLLRAAGATIGTQVSLRPDLVDPTKSSLVGGVVDAAATPDLDRTGEPFAVASRELTHALVEPKAPAAATVTEAQAASTLEAFSQGDLIDIEGDVQPRGTMAVLLTGEAVTGADPAGVEQRVRSLLTLARTLDAGSSGVVVAGPLTAVDEGGLLRALREDNDLNDDVSSVDGVDRAPGRIATVFALREQAAGDSGSYGTGDDNDGPAPSSSE